MMKGVVITGVGLISSLGDSSGLFQKKLCDGRSGLSELGEHGAQRGPRPGGKAESFVPEKFLQGRSLRPLDRTGLLLASAAKLALDSSGWTAEQLSSHDIGLVLGTMFGSMHTIMQFDRQSLVRGPSCASPMDFANTVINSAAGQTAIWHKLRGINSTTATGATSGLMAIGYAADLIQSGRQAAILAGGADEFCFESFCGLERAHLLCGSDADAAEGCPVPFDRRRTGIALAEAGGLLMLEDADSASARGAVALGKIGGHANAYNPRWNLPGRGTDAIVRAMQGALEDAQLSPQSIGCISAAANGSISGDRDEAVSIQSLFMKQNSRVPITAIKAMVGETLGAAGALQAISLLETLRNRVLPGIVGLQQTDPDLENLNFCRSPEFVDTQAGLINAVGFDGHACSLVLSGPQ